MIGQIILLLSRLASLAFVASERSELHVHYSKLSIDLWGNNISHCLKMTLTIAPFKRIQATADTINMPPVGAALPTDLPDPIPGV